MKTKNLLAALAFVVALPAHAVGRFTDASDLWWNANEPGWGVNVVHENEVLFLTFFVYGPNRNPVWYSASDVRFQGSANGVVVYQGALHETHGPWFNDYFDAPSVLYRQVGTVMFRLTSAGTATMVYTVDGITIQKQLTRYTWRVNEFGGAYLGALAGTYSNCPSPTSNGLGEEGGLRMVVTQVGGNVTIQSTGNTATCVYSGDYTQQGRMGAMSGAYTCTNGTVGTFSATELEANPQAFSARLEMTTNNCNFSGRFGGIRRN